MKIKEQSDNLFLLVSTIVKGLDPSIGINMEPKSHSNEVLVGLTKYPNPSSTKYQMPMTLQFPLTVPNSEIIQSKSYTDALTKTLRQNINQLNTLLEHHYS